MSTNETNSIDEKKNTSEPKADFSGFFKNYISSILFTIGFSVFIIGTTGLYTTKIAQANILPDNPELAPYTIYDRIIQKDIPIDINVMRPNFFSENKETFSQKVTFNSQEYLDTFKNSFLCSIRNSATPGGLGNVSLYLSLVYDNIIAKVFLAINTVFFYLSYLPESIIMLLYGFVYLFIWMIIYFYVFAISIFYHIVKIPQLFRENEKFVISESDNPDINYIKENIESNWEPEENIKFMRGWKILLFIFCIYPIMFSILISAFIFSIYGFIATLYATYKVNINKTEKTEGIYNFIINTFKHKKFFFLVLATISLYTNGTSYFGNKSAVPITIGILVAWFMNLYSNKMPELGIDGFTAKIRQNPIKAKVEPLNVKKLVDLCGWIRVTSLNELILKTPFRKTGGNSDVNIISQSKNVSFNPNIKIISPENPKNTEITEIPEIELKTFQSEIPNTATTTTTTTTTTEIPNSEIELKTIQSETPSPEVPQEQPKIVGGKKIKRNYNKKYNIKFS